MERIQEWFESPLGSSIGNFLIALVILIVGYIVARIIASIVRRLLERTQFDDRLAQALTDPEGESAPRFDVEDTVGKIVFWVIMLFVIVAFFERLGLLRIAGPIDAFLQDVTTVYLPRIGGAALLLAAAWILATVLRFLVIKGAGLLKVDERLSKHAALEEGERVSVSKSLGTAVFWFIFLLFLPSVLSALGIEEVAAPVQGIFDDLLGYLPNIFGAAIIFLIGWFVARIVRQIVTNLLQALGLDAIGERIGMPGEQSLSRLLGTILYVFILLFTLVSALERLDIAAISDPATMMLNTIINAIPNLIGAAVVLIVSYYIGRFIGRLVADLVQSLGGDRIPERLGINLAGTMTLSQIVGYLITVAIMLFAVSSAAELLESDFLVEAIGTFIAFFWRVILAVVILGIGLYFARLAYNVVMRAGGNNALFTARLARIVVVIFAAAVALRQIGIANEIVDLAFGLLLAAIAVAIGLSFGLGSREIAGREVDAFLSSWRSPEGISAGSLGSGAASDEAEALAESVEASADLPPEA